MTNKKRRALITRIGTKESVGRAAKNSAVAAVANHTVMPEIYGKAEKNPQLEKSLSFGYLTEYI